MHQAPSTKDSFLIGRISRTHGTKGEVELSFTSDAFDRGESPYLLLEVDGLLVPFFWQEYRFKGETTALFTFEGYNTQELSQELVGCPVRYPLSALSEEEEEDGTLPSYQALTGFSVFTPEGDELGEVVSVDDATANVLLTLRREGGEECLIPYHDDLLHHFSLSRRQLFLCLPPGLLSINRM